MFGQVAKMQQQLDDHVEECKRLRQEISGTLDRIVGQLDQVLTDKDERAGALKERERQLEARRHGRAVRIGELTLLAILVAALLPLWWERLVK